MKIVKKERKDLFTEQDLTDMYAEKILNEDVKDDKCEEGFITYLGKTWKDGFEIEIAVTFPKDIEIAIAEHNDNKEFCNESGKPSENCYYCAFLGKIIAKGVVCLIDAYAVEN